MKRFQKFLRIVLGLLFGASLALSVMPYVIAHYIDSSLLVFEAMIFLHMLVAYGVYTIILIIHEAGHLISGLMSGYSFVSYRIWSLTIIKLDGKLRVKRFKLTGTAGQCLMKPPLWTEKGIPVRFYNLGGILLNLVCCLLTLPFCFLYPVTTFWGMIRLSFTVLSGMTFLLNGIPNQNNDGDNVFSLYKDPVAVRAFWSQMMGVALLAEGVALKDIPEDLYDLPEGADLRNPLLAASAANWAQIPLYHHRFEEADEAISHVLEEASGMPPVLRFLLKNERVWFEVMHEDRKETLDAFMDTEFQKFQKSMASYPSVIRVLYTMALRNGEEENAAKYRKAMDSLEKTYPYYEEVKEERFLMKMAEEHMAARSDRTAD
ncbi:MAG: hypothetical protein KBS81_05495 [Spirochaetales bacterium]|nr:hypothetical protein [Candidatus Physcosoma equi]